MTYTGTVPVIGRTVAVDPAVIPLGSHIKIGDQEYVAEDTGVIGRVIDLYVGTEADAEVFGVQEVEVYIKLEEK